MAPALATHPEQPPVVVESMQTHTPLDPHVGALTFTQGHAEVLRQRRQNQPPPMPTRSVQHVAPYARDPASGAQGRTC